MSRKRIKQYLMLLTVVGLIAVAANGSGTFASFNATAENDGNTFSTGSLLLSDTIGSATCNSKDTSGTNVSSSNGANSVVCSTKIDVEKATPGNALSGSVTLTNLGTLAGDLALTAAGGCSDTGQASDGFNTGTLCDNVVMNVLETQGSTTTCLFGEGHGTSTCSATWSSYTTANDSMDAFFTALPSITLNSLQPAPGTGGDNAVQLTFSFYLPSTGTNAGDNIYQDVSATFPLTWTLTQQ